MITSASFCWHIMLILNGLLLRLSLMKAYYRTSKKMRDMCEELMEIDNIENGIIVTKNIEETKFLSLVSDDEDF